MLNEVKHLIRFLTYVRNDKKEEKKPLPATQYSHLSQTVLLAKNSATRKRGEVTACRRSGVEKTGN